jgi:ATP-dependent helicase Lhr and Lhr-like helicase
MTIERADATRTPLPRQLEDWFDARGWQPRPHQRAMVASTNAHKASLLIAPTGGGKTLGGFLPSLVDLMTTPRASHASVHTLYVSPLKALTTDVARNLTVPVKDMGLPVTIETRTGDTPANRRTRQRAHPPDMLLTTPEQIGLFIAQENAGAFFADLRFVILDEIHAIAPSKRGDLLSLGLSRIEALSPNLRRVGLSATVRDEDHLCRWLGGAGEPAALVRGQGGAEPVIRILTPDDAHIPWSGHSGRHAFRAVYEEIRKARTTLIFVNTRSQAEMTFQGLWAVNEDTLPIALHHGALDVGQRRKVEAAMTKGALRAVVCTSTLDLGIDWGDVDLVVQMGAPKGSARLIQRLGRANHRMDEPSEAVLAPANRFEILECRAAVEAVRAMELDGEPWRDGALDILCQHIMARACGDPFDLHALYEEVRAAFPYRSLDRATFEEAVELVATGGYSLKSYERYRRIVRGRDGLWRVRNREIAQRTRMNIGAIVEDTHLDVRLGRMPRAEKAATGKPRTERSAKAMGGRSIGRIEEWFASQLTPGDSFVFAGQILTFHGIEETTCYVCPAPPGKEPKVPTWAGGKFPLSTYLAARVRAMIADPDLWEGLPGPVAEWLEVQREVSVLPSETDMLVESFPRNGRHFLVSYPFEGRLAHATLGMLLTRRLERAGKRPIGFVANDYALSVWGLHPMGDLDMAALFDEDMLGDDLDAWLAESNLMKRSFRYCAIIAGLIEKRQPGKERTGRQITISTDLIYDVLKRHQSDHLLLRAAWADAAAGLLDIKRLGEGLHRIKGHIVHRDLARVSPLAVPVMLEIGREHVAGDADEEMLAEAGVDLIEEAMGRRA